MAQITVQELYSGEKYDIMSKVVADYMKHGRPAQIPEDTWLDMLVINHMIATIEKMKKEGDFISAKPMWSRSLLM